jgi:uncharacterized protein YcbK (DUF882 family)
MRTFIDSCRRKVAAVSLIVVGAVAVPMLATGPAHADNTYVFRGEVSPAPSGRSSGRKFTKSKRMHLGATTSRRQRKSLTGGSARISARHGRRHADRRARGVRTASLGTDFAPAQSFERSLTGARVTWVAKSGCLNGSLRAVIAQVANTFGPVTVTSTCRSRRHNSRVGGARHSHHLSGRAVDFRVRGASARAVYAFLRSHASVGGLKLYRRGFFHIDLGARRSW